MVTFCLSLLIGCGGGSDSGSGAGSSSGTSSGPVLAACSDERVYGTWELTVTVNGVTQIERITVGPEDEDSGNLTIDGNNFTYTEDGVTLRGTINDDCTAMNGTATDDATGLSGTWSAVKI